jgi:hypothetical protein
MEQPGQLAKSLFLVNKSRCIYESIGLSHCLVDGDLILRLFG